MGRTRRSTTTGYPRRSPYNLRSRSKTNYDFFSSLSANDVKKTAEKVEALPKVTDLDLCKTENAAAHHTAQYYADYLVLRRGQAFTFRLKLDRKLKLEEKVVVILTTGRTPYPSKGTLLFFPLRDSVKKFGWKMDSSTTDEEEFNLTLVPSPDAIIGKYHVTVQISSETAVKTSKLTEMFCLVFNPWSAEDDTYMEGVDEKDEYVMNETGRIWVGSKSSNHGKPWIFGQFEECCLETALYVLDISDLADAALSNPITVARTFTKMANHFDDDGILAGNWSGDYSGGVEPTDWVSSVAILKEYWETKKEVKYGQCWVFSGILTSLLRSVGIPARPITNFESAHDTDISMTIDRHWDCDNKPLTDLDDSIWNFHVWNEAWFKRSDLPDGHDGWQVVDGTPQETSDGVMQCGPSSLHSIKEGQVYLPFDAKFIIAEVNGDILEWVKNKSGEMNPVWIERSSVGFNISTKSVGSALREDVTHLYKYAEGTDMERKVVASLSQYSSRKGKLQEFYDLPQIDTVKFSLEGSCNASGDIDVTLAIDNADTEVVNIDVTLTYVSSFYNGRVGDELKVEKRNIKLSPKEKTSVTSKLVGEGYLNKIATDAEVTLFCKANVRETCQEYLKKEMYKMDTPDVELDVQSSVSVNEHFSVEISFTNQLNVALTECRFIIDGPGVQPVKPVKLISSVISPGETIHQTMTLKARSVGVKEIVCLLHTRQLQNITGSAIITVS